MAEAKIDPEQLREAVNASLKRALERDRDVIRRPILIGIIAYPDDRSQVAFEDIQAIAVDVNS